MNSEIIFVTALEKKNPEERKAYLQEACGEDKDLRKEVEELLQAHEKAGDFLDVAPQDLLPEDATQDLQTAGFSEDSSQVIGETGDKTIVSDESLDFLQPSDKPDRLGQLGRYEIIEVLGKGGFGLVLRAFDPKLNRVVAIKVLAPELAMNATARKRFLREAQAAAVVSHNHVVTIHEIEEEARPPYIVMECVDGRSLEEKIVAEGSLDVKEILRIGLQTASGLASAHAQGLIHRDIKPGNILLENGVQRVKITDFGLARAVDDVNITQTGVVAGTPQYMSPEQAEGEQLDYRTDLFSLGSVMYAMCTGRAPFRASSALAVLRRVVDDEPRPIREVNPDIPEWLEAIISHLMAKDPNKRIKSAQEVSDLLSQYLAHLQHPTVTPPPKSPITMRMKKTPKKDEPFPGRRRWLPAAAVLLLLIGALGLTEATGVTRLASTVIRIFTPNGTLVVEVDDPNVSVTIEGEDIVIKGAGAKEIRLKPGQYKVLATIDGKVVQRELITVHRNGRQIVRITQEGLAAFAKGALKKEMDFVVKAVRNKDGSVEIPKNHPLIWQLSDKNTRKLLELFAYLPKDSHDLLLEKNYLKWKYTELDEDRKAVYKNAVDLNKKMAKQWPENMSLAELEKSDVGFAMVTIPKLRTKVISWYILFPKGNPLWVTMVGTKAAGKRPYFDAHFKQLPELRKKAYTPLPATFETKANFQLVKRFPPVHKAFIKGLALSKDGQRAFSVAAYKENNLVLWDLEKTSPKIRYSRRNGGHCASMALAPAGDYAVIGRKGVVEFWDLNIGKMIAQSKEHSGMVWATAVSSDGKQALTGGHNDDFVCLWDVAGGKLLKKIPIGLESCIEAVFTQDGNAAVLGSYVGCELVDLNSGKPIRSFHSQKGGRPTHVSGLAISPNGSMVLGGHGAKSRRLIHLWDMNTGKLIQTFEGHTGYVDSLDFLADNKHIITSARDGTMRIWSIATGKEVARVSHDNAIFNYLAVTPDGRHVITGGGLKGSSDTKDVEYTGDYDLRLWQLPKSVWPENQITLVRKFTGLKKFLHHVTYSPDGISVFATDGHTVMEWDRESGQLKKTHRVHPGGNEAIRSIKILPGGQQIVTATVGKGIHVWSLGDGRLLKEFPVIKGNEHWHIRDVSADGRLLLTTGRDEVTRVWDLESGKKLHEFASSSEAGGAFHPDGKHAAYSKDHTIKLFNLESGKVVWETVVQSGPVNFHDIDISPDGRYLVAGSSGENPIVALLDAKNGRTIQIIPNESAIWDGIEFLPDGKHFIAGCYDKTIRIWETASGKEVFRRGVTNHVTQHLAVSPDGKTVITGGGANWWEKGEPETDFDVYLWRLPENVWQRNRIELVRKFPPCKANIRAVAFLPNERVASVDATGEVQVREISSGKILQSLQIPLENGVAAISPDGRLVLAAKKTSPKKKKPIQLWDLTTGKMRWNQEFDEGVHQLQFLPNDKILVRRNDWKAVTLHDLKDGKEVSRFPEIGWVMGDVAISPDGKLLFVNVSHGGPRLQVFRIETGAKIIDKKLDSGVGMRPAVWSPDSRYVITSDYEGTIGVWNAITGALVRSWHSGDSRIRSLIIDAAGHLYCGGVNRISVWNWMTGDLLAQAETPNLEGIHLALSPDGTRLISGGGWWWDSKGSGVHKSGDYALRLWRLPESVWPKNDITLVRKLDGHTNVVRAIQERGQGKEFVSVDADGNVLYWDAALERVTDRLKVAEYVSDARFSPDGRLLAICNDTSKEKSVVLWDLLSRKQVHTLKHNFDWIESLAFSDDHSRLLAFGRPGIGVVWDSNTGKELQRIDPEYTWDKRVHAGVFLADGSQVALSNCKHVKVYEVGTGKLLQSLELTDNRINRSMVATPTRLAVTHLGGRVSVVDLTSWKVYPSFQMTPQSHKFAAFDGQFLWKEKYLLLAGSPDQLAIWDMDDGTTVGPQAQPERGRTLLAVSSDGRQVITANGWDKSDDFALRLWRLPESVWLPSIDTVLSDGLKVLLNFEKNTWFEKNGKQYVRDLSARGNHGLATGDKFGIQMKLLPQGLAGAGGKGHNLYFSSPLIAGLSEYTIAGWVKVSPETFAEKYGSRIYRECFHKVAQPKFVYEITRNGSLKVNAKNDAWLDAKSKPHMVPKTGWVFLAVTLQNGGHNKGELRFTVNDRSFHTLSQSVERIKANGFALLGDSKLEAVDEIAIFERALSANEIEALRREGLAGRPLRLYGMKLKQTFKGPSSSIFRVAFSPDGNLAAAVADDGFVNVWEVSSGKQILRSRAGLHLRGLNFSPVGRLMVTCGFKVCLWDLADRKKLRELPHDPDQEKHVKNVWFTPDGLHCYGPDGRGVTHVWNIESGKEVMTFKGSAVRFHAPSGTFLISEGKRIAKVGLDGKIQQTYDSQSDLTNKMALSTNGLLLANGTKDGPVLIWKIGGGQPTKLEGHQARSGALTFLDGDTKIVTRSPDRTIRLWEVETGEEFKRWSFQVFPFDGPVIQSIGDGRYFAIGNLEDRLLIVDARTGREILRSKTPEDGTRALAVSSDGKLLLTGGGWHHYVDGDFQRTENEDVYLWQLPENLFLEKTTNANTPMAKSLAMTIKVGRGEMKIPSENNRLAKEMADPNGKKLIKLFANLPDDQHQLLLKQGYLKWPFAKLDEKRQEVYELGFKFYLDTYKKQGQKSPHTLEDLKNADAGFAIVDVPNKKESMISWFVLVGEQPVWWYIQSVQVPADIPAHNVMLPGVRKGEYSPLPTVDEDKGEEIEQSDRNTNSAKAIEPADVRRKLMQIAKAMHARFDTFARFPVSANKRDPSGPAVSWRVELLPYLGYDSLFNRYKFDQPWDSPANSKLLKEIPEIYRTGPGAEEGKTRFALLVGEGSPWGNEGGPRDVTFQDGLFVSLFIVRAGKDKAIPWTKPEDLKYDAKNPVAALGDLGGDPILCAFGDAGVHTISPKIKAEAFLQLITPADGVPVDMETITVGPSRTLLDELRESTKAAAKDLADLDLKLRKDLETLNDSKSQLYRLRRDLMRLKSEQVQIDYQLQFLAMQLVKAKAGESVQVKPGDQEGNSKKLKGEAAIKEIEKLQKDLKSKGELFAAQQENLRDAMKKVTTSSSSAQTLFNTRYQLLQHLSNLRQAVTIIDRCRDQQDNKTYLALKKQAQELQQQIEPLVRESTSSKQKLPEVDPKDE